MTENLYGESHPRWRGAKSPTAAGYLRIRVNGKLVYEHRHVMEQQLGRTLSRNEHVHHEDGNRANNSPENLEVVPVGAHNRRHTKERWEEGGDLLGRLEAAERCGQPRIDRHALGKPCRRLKPCPFHGP